MEQRRYDEISSPFLFQSTTTVANQVYGLKLIYFSTQPASIRNLRKAIRPASSFLNTPA